MVVTVLGVLGVLAGPVLLLVPPAGDPGAGLFAGLMTAAGGLALLFRHRLGLPGRVTGVVAGLSAVTGTIAGLAVRSAGLCCMFGYHEVRGWPFGWLSRSGSADTAAEAVRLAEAGGWGFAGAARLLGNAVVWAYAGVVVVVVISLLRRAGRERRPARA